MVSSISIRGRSDFLQQLWQAMIDIRNSDSSTNYPVLRNWHYCSHELQRNINALWQNSMSWEFEVLHLSRQYIRGLLPYHPGFEEPVWEETRAILPGLLALHDYGILTTYSEPGSFSSEVDDGVVVATRMRPHLFFSLPTRNTRIDEPSIRRFLYGLQRSEDIWYHIAYHYPANEVPDSPNRAFPECSGQVFTNLPGPDCTKFVCEQNKCGEAEWEDESSQPFPGPEHRNQQGTGGLNDFDRPFKACLAVDPLQICVISRDFTKSSNEKLDLQELVLKLLKASGFTPWPQPDAAPHHNGALVLTGSMNLGIEEDCIKKVLEQLVFGAEAAQKQPDCVEAYAFPRADDNDIVDEPEPEAAKYDTRINGTEEEVEEPEQVGRHDGNTVLIRNSQLTPEENSDHEDNIAFGRTKRTTGHDIGSIIGLTNSERARTSLTQIDAAASLTLLSKSE